MSISTWIENRWIEIRKSVTETRKSEKNLFFSFFVVCTINLILFILNLRWQPVTKQGIEDVPLKFEEKIGKNILFLNFKMFVIHHNS